MTRMIRWTLVVGLAFAAQQATAQAGAAPGAPAGSAAATDPNATPALQAVHEMNVMLIQAGQLAEQRGTTPNVKEYGKRLVDEHQRLDAEAKQMAQKRGIQLANDDQIRASPAHAKDMQRLQSLSGIQFDEAMMDALVQEREARVPALKQLRDSIPGRDAELKKWLSDVEVTMEHTRNESRDVRQAVRQEAQKQQRQGRKP